ncbi:MAG TPA: F0F1 ATP synthase subunit epsilon [Terriglobia bacterium]|nr:F0F1 ATP synthase subunit epsilon [Terriglobia bacterium]
MADLLPTSIQLQIVTPDREIADAEVEEVSIPGKEGDLGVLPGHAPLLTELRHGTLEYRQGGKRHYVAIHWGFAEVLSNRVIVLADLAERAEEIDIGRAESKRQSIEEYLKSHPGSDDPEIEKARDDLRRAICRVETAHHARG